MNLKDIRKARGLTQKQVADAVGVAEATVSRWESGDIGNMKRDKIQSLANILLVRPSDLLEDDIVRPSTVTIDVSKMTADQIETLKMVAIQLGGQLA